jgi:hypothetical protein
MSIRPSVMSTAYNTLRMCGDRAPGRSACEICNFLQVGSNTSGFRVKISRFVVKSYHIRLALGISRSEPLIICLNAQAKQ